MERSTDGNVDARVDSKPNQVEHLNTSTIAEDSLPAKAAVAARVDGAPTDHDGLPKVTIENFGKVSDGIYRGAAPKPDQVEELKNMGVKTIIDLRVPDSDFHREENAAKQAGINYYNEPLFYSRPSEYKMSEIMQILNDPAMQPVYVHCREGEDRTGTVIGTERRLVDNWNWKDTYSEMLHYGFHPFYKGLANFVENVPSTGLPNFHTHK